MRTLLQAGEGVAGYPQRDMLERTGGGRSGKIRMGRLRDREGKGT
jgi:hypothetical protein